MTEKRKAKSRANGTGTAIRSGKTWIARVVIGWKPSKDGSHKVPVYKSRSGFPSRTAALNYCPELLKMACSNLPQKRTLQAVWDEWEESYAERIKPGTMAGYRAAYKHYARLSFSDMRSISPGDLQSCMDDCTAGKRTHQMMKVTAGLLWAFAKDHRYVDEDITENLYTGKGKSVKRKSITDGEVDTIQGAIGKERYAEYIYCLCYLGFRPGEFLKLRKSDFSEPEGIPVLVGGSKTEAGTDRIVVIPPQIIDIVRDRLFIPGTDLLFPMYVYGRGKQSDRLQKLKPMTDAYFRESVFKPMMDRLGCDSTKVPYCARHTYSDKLKRAEGSDKTKAELMGHTNYAFTQSRYQSTDLEDMLAVAVSID